MRNTVILGVPTHRNIALFGVGLALLHAPAATPGEDPLRASLWEGQWNCPECVHTMPRNTPEQHAEKVRILSALRSELAAHSFQAGRVDHGSEYIEHLGDDGIFSDLSATERRWSAGLSRLAVLAQRFHWKRGDERLDDPVLRRRVLRAAAYYARGEADNPGQAGGWHGPAFAVPRYGVEIFFAFLPEMEAVETGELSDPLFREAFTQLRRIALQAFTTGRPGEGHASKHPVSPERFRHDAAWVGGNALGYRRVFPVAALFRSVEMMDTVAYVAEHALAPASHAGIEAGTAFWNEGICADGLGWGHGRQAYSQYYPWHGVYGMARRGALQVLRHLKDTPYLSGVGRKNLPWLLNFMRGVTWEQYRGYRVPVNRGRYTFSVEAGPSENYHVTRILAQALLEHFNDWLTDEQRAELRDAADRGGVLMDGYPRGQYLGTRVFWNNDAIARKTEDYYVYIAMSSSRTDGVESYHWGANDYRNLFNTDGFMVLLRNGDELNRHKGAWEITAMPGITARQARTAEITPRNNYRGFNSLHNVAGAVANGPYGAGGFIYEKNDDTLHPHPEIIYGVYAHKGYFIFDQTIVCLGAGIEDRRAHLGGEVWTTLNQTAWRSDVRHGLTGAGQTEVLPLDDATHRRSLALNRDAGDPWFAQDGVLYVVLANQTDGAVEWLAERRMTHWQELTHRSIENEPLHMFQLSINHGERPAGARYGYVMRVGMTADPAAAAADLPVDVLHNTASLQAVTTTDGRVVQAVFYDADAVCRTGRGEIRVSAPAVVMLAREAEGMRITVSDPCQDRSLRTLELRITDPVAGGQVTQEDGLYSVRMLMPDVPEVGRPVTAFIPWRRN